MPEGVEVFRRSGEARSFRVASVFGQQIRTPEDAFYHIVAARRSCGTGECSIVSRFGTDYGRSPVGFRESAGDETDYTQVPVFAFDDQDFLLREPFRLNLYFRLADTSFLQLLSLLIQAVDFFGIGFSFLPGSTPEQVQSQFGRCESAGAVDPRSKEESDGCRVHGLIPGSRRLLEGSETGTYGLCQDLHSPFGEHAVLAYHWRDVCHRSQGNQVQKRVEIAPAFFLRDEFSHKGLHDLEGHAHSGQSLEWVRTVCAIRIDNGFRRRQPVLGMVVIDHQNVYT